MMRFLVMDSSLVVEFEQSLEVQNIYITHMEYKDISHRRKKKGINKHLILH